MPTDSTPSDKTAPQAQAPLPREQRVLYVAAMKQTEAMVALEGMQPTAQDKAATAAIVAGRVAPEQAREELLAYVREHQTMRGFIESRSWAT